VPRLASSKGFSHDRHHSIVVRKPRHHGAIDDVELGPRLIDGDARCETADKVEVGKPPAVDREVRDAAVVAKEADSGSQWRRAKHGWRQGRIQPQMLNI
jgi:hypothetical protein